MGMVPFWQTAMVVSGHCLSREDNFGDVFWQLGFDGQVLGFEAIPSQR